MIENVGGVGEPAFECRQAQLAFNKLSGKWINGYAGGVPDKWLEILAQVIDEGPKAAMSDWLILNLPLNRKQNKLR